MEVTRGSSGERFEGERDSGEEACLATSVCFRENEEHEWSCGGDRVCFVKSGGQRVWGLEVSYQFVIRR